jgi:hypothetical protein
MIMRAPTPPFVVLFSLFGVQELRSCFLRCGMAYLLSVCLVCLGVMEGPVTGISIIVSAVLTLSSSFPFQRDLSSLELTISLFIYSPFISFILRH